MALYRSRPSTVEAFQHANHKAPVPAEFADIKAMTAGGEIKITKDPVGQLLVPVDGAIRTCRIGDYVLKREDGGLEVMSRAQFEARYELDGEPAPAEKEGDAVEAPVAE